MLIAKLKNIKLLLKNIISAFARTIKSEIADMHTLMLDRDTSRGIAYSISDASAKYM